MYELTLAGVYFLGLFMGICGTVAYYRSEKVQ